MIERLKRTNLSARKNEFLQWIKPEDSGGSDWGVGIRRVYVQAQTS